MPEKPLVQQHGPKFMVLSGEQRQQLIRMRNNLGHPDATVLGNVLRDQGWPNEAIEGIKNLGCPACFERQKPKLSRPSSLADPKDFNEVVAIDAVQWTSDQGEVYQFYHMIDMGTNFQVAFPSRSRTSSDLIQLISINWVGPPQMLMSDSAGEFCSEEFGRFLQSYDTKSRVIPAEARWQLGKAERHGAIIQDMLTKYQHDHTISSESEFELGLSHCIAAKNSLARHRGYAPEILFLGKSRHVPASIADDQGIASELQADGSESQDHEITEFQKHLSRRESAKVAFIRADNDVKLRRSLLRQSFLQWVNGLCIGVRKLGKDLPRLCSLKIAIPSGLPT